MTTLRTEEETARNFDRAWGYLKPEALKDLADCFRHDRLAITTALVEAGNEMKAVSYDEKNMTSEETSAYNQAIYDYQNIIRTLLESKN